MRRVTYYEEYPIYESAEGGYYYSGNSVIESEIMSKRKCRMKFEEIWKKCQKENEELGFVDGVDWHNISLYHRIYPWIRINDHMIVKNSFYIGEGRSYVIEKHYGSKKRGRVPYC